MAVDTIETPASAPESAPASESAPAAEPHSEHGFLSSFKSVFKRESTAGPEAASDAPQAASEPAATPSVPAPTPDAPPAEPASQPYRAFRDEEEYRRHIQGETDRELARREKANRERQINDYEARIAALPDEYTPDAQTGKTAGTLAKELVALRNGEKLEASQAKQALDDSERIGELLGSYDQVTLWRRIHKLPDARQQAIMAGLDQQADGVTQRTYLSDRLIEAEVDLGVEAKRETIEKAAWEKGWQAARKDAGLRKELLSELREFDEEPDNIAGAPGVGTITQAIFDANRSSRAWIREHRPAIEAARLAGRITH